MPHPYSFHHFLLRPLPRLRQLAAEGAFFFNFVLFLVSIRVMATRNCKQNAMRASTQDYNTACNTIDVRLKQPVLEQDTPVRFGVGFDKLEIATKVPTNNESAMVSFKTVVTVQTETYLLVTLSSFLSVLAVLMASRRAASSWLSGSCVSSYIWSNSSLKACLDCDGQW